MNTTTRARAHRHTLTAPPLQVDLLICKFMGRLPGAYFSDAVLCMKLCRSVPGGEGL
jgi:hypothetical protein